MRLGGLPRRLVGSSRASIALFNRSRLYVQTGSTQSATGDMTVTVRVNGVDTTVITTVTAVVRRELLEHSQHRDCQPWRPNRD